MCVCIYVCMYVCMYFYYSLSFFMSNVVHVSCNADLYPPTHMWRITLRHTTSQKRTQSPGYAIIRYVHLPFPCLIVEKLCCGFSDPGIQCQAAASSRDSRGWLSHAETLQTETAGSHRRAGQIKVNFLYIFFLAILLPT